MSRRYTNKIDLTSPMKKKKKIELVLFARRWETYVNTTLFCSLYVRICRHCCVFNSCLLVLRTEKRRAAAATCW